LRFFDVAAGPEGAPLQHSARCDVLRRGVGKDPPDAGALERPSQQHADDFGCVALASPGGHDGKTDPGGQRPMPDGVSQAGFGLIRPMVSAMLWPWQAGGSERLGPGGATQRRYPTEAAA